MSEAGATKEKKATKSIDQEISALREKLKKLEEKKKEDQRREKERNQRAVVELLRAEKLDVVDILKWQDAMPKIRVALLGKAASGGQGGGERAEVVAA